MMVRILFGMQLDILRSAPNTDTSFFCTLLMWYCQVNFSSIHSPRYFSAFERWIILLFTVRGGYDGIILFLAAIISLL